MIARRGSSTRIPGARPGVDLAGAACPVRRSQRRRDPGAPARGRRPASTQSSPRDDLGRQSVYQRVEQAAAHAAAPAAACLAEDPAALARRPRRPPLDLPKTATGPATHAAADPGLGAADGRGEPHLGLPTHPGELVGLATRSPPPPSGKSSRQPTSTPPRNDPDRPGDSSSPRRPTRSSLSTSRTPTRSSCAVSTSW
jgi:hypothetical protein